MPSFFRRRNRSVEASAALDQDRTYRDALNGAAKHVIAGGKTDPPEVTPSTAFDVWAVTFHAVSHMSTANLEATLGLGDARELLDWTLFFLLAVSIAAELKSEGTEVELMDAGVLLLTKAVVLKQDRAEPTKRLSLAYEIARVLIHKVNGDPANNALLRDLTDGFWQGVRAFIYTRKESILDQMSALYLIFFRDVFVRVVETIGRAQEKPNVGG